MRGGHGIILLTFGGRATRVCGLTGKKKKRGLSLCSSNDDNKSLACCFGVCRIKTQKFCLISNLGGNYLFNAQGYVELIFFVLAVKLQFE